VVSTARTSTALSVVRGKCVNADRLDSGPHNRRRSRLTDARLRCALANRVQEAFLLSLKASGTPLEDTDAFAT
jgi:hypothetical protein